MEGSAHDVVLVASQDGDYVAILPVPDPDCLVIRCREDPGQVVVELNSPNVIKMPSQHEKTLLHLVVPHSHFVIVSSTHEQRLGLVESDASHRLASMLVVLVEQDLCRVVEQLDLTIVQRG